MTSQEERASYRVQALGALLGLGACGLAPDEGRVGPGVLLIVVDGLRADHLSSFGYDRPTTPALDLLADDGLRFTHAFTAAPLLVPSHASLMTGSDPFLARRFLPREFEGHEERNWRIPEALPRLAAEFLAAGWRTAAFVDDPALDPVFGFGVGFQLYDLPESPAPSGSPAHERCTRFLSWLQTLDRGSRWFATLHLSDLERSWAAPQGSWEEYFPPRPELSEVPPVGTTDAVLFSVPHSRWRGGSHTLGEYEASYDGHLRKVDEELGELCGSLRRLGRFEQTSIAVVGSFGVQFGEAGLYLCSGRYSLADLHVPWILRLRQDSAVRSTRAGAIDDLASSIDVAPTLLALEGIQPPRGMLGLSFRSRIEGGPQRAPVRSFVFASCGMQEGGAVLGAQDCLEVLFPGEVVEGAVRRAWFGEEVAPDSAAVVRFYPWKRKPFHPLSEVGLDLANATCRSMWEAWNLRAERLRKAQHLLQRYPLADAEVDAAEQGELAELGYLGEIP